MDDKSVEVPVEALVNKLTSQIASQALRIATLELLIEELRNQVRDGQVKEDDNG